MSRSPILFRCDGTAERGWEPFYQSLVLAQAIQRRRRGTHIVGQLDPMSLALYATRGGHEWRDTPHAFGTPADATATCREIYRLSPAAVVVIGDASPEYLAELGATGVLVVAMDGDGLRAFPNRLVVHPFLGRERRDFQLERGAQLALGERYPMVRPHIRRLRPLRAQEPAQPYRVMVSLGDDDFAGQTLPVCRTLLETPGVGKVVAAIRTHHFQRDELTVLAEESGGRFETVIEVPELSTRLNRCHFAISAGDTTSLEFACLGMPQIICVQKPEHLANAVALDDEGAATNLGMADAVTPDAFREAVDVLLSDPMERQGQTRCGRQLIDGRGPDRFVNAVEVMLHPSRVEGLRLVA